MRFSEQWLREWISPKLNTHELAEKLTLAGLEVDNIEAACSKFTKVFVGEVKTLEPHPKAEKLALCQVEALEGTHTVVCGAPNVQIGQKVPFAQIGAHLPMIHKPNETLQAREVQGVLSEGMLLSQKELGLSDEAEGLYVLNQSAPVGASLWDHLHLEDTVIELDLTPNRGDCLSIQGLAREIHALTKASLHPIKIQALETQSDKTLSVSLEVPDGCPRYCGRIIQNVDCSQPTPDWMREKLRRSDVRSINAIVDIMNYVMLELGQPMHAFDLDKLEGKISVRMSKAGETLTLLDGTEATLDDETLLISDVKKPLAMAGIMGGEASAVTTATQHVFLESAFFKPEFIAGKGRAYGLHTDSSHRFERGVDPALQKQAIIRATQWIIDICGGEPGKIIDEQSDFMPLPTLIDFNPKRAQQLLGCEVKSDSMQKDLARLGCKIELMEDTWQVTPPSFRFDLTRQEDLFEEIARCVGYDEIPMLMPEGQLQASNEKFFGPLRVKQLFADLGYQEAITYSFVDEALQTALCPDKTSLPLKNPIASDMGVMRQRLWPGLLKALQHNVHRQQANVFLFETGLVFEPTPKGLRQEPKLGGVAMGVIDAPHWGEQPTGVDFYDIKGHLETLWQLNGKDITQLKWQPSQNPALHPGSSADIVYEDKTIGLCGALHPKFEKRLGLKGPVFVFELDLESVLQSQDVQFEKLSSYPSIRRDISVIVKETVMCDDVCQWIRSESGNLLKDLVVFDVYQGAHIGADQKSMALGLIWQDANRTLVDKEIDEKMQTLFEGLKGHFGAQLRE